ncbi:MAG: hypothetical protein KDM91_03770 [Verrucomicrobiae bacterium]|nr:hypothetical protein [Verrucomicrobiae bacterium]MCP5540764.1 hypothetical protein [Akkermansiaceae bacterium]
MSPISKVSPSAETASARAAVLPVALALFLGACNDGPSGRVLEHRIERLQAEIELQTKRADAALTAAEAATSQLKQRLEEAERKGQEALDQSSAMASGQDERFERLEKAISSALRMKEDSEGMAYLDTENPGHRTVQTEHGTFLVRLESIEPNPNGGGFLARLNFGNPAGLTIQEFILKGDFGQPPPPLKPGESYGEYSARLDEWQKTQTPFEESILTELEPNAWTSAVLPLKAPSKEALKLIRFAMIVRRAHLINQEGKGEYSQIIAGGSGANLVKSDYGPFLFNVQRREPEGSGLRIYAMVGNPFGFAVNESRLRGQFGPAPPKKMETESPVLFAERMRAWSEQMRDFEATITETIAPLSWSQVSFLMPAGSPEEVVYIRCMMNVDNITLPRGGGASGSSTGSPGAGSGGFGGTLAP